MTLPPLWCLLKQDGASQMSAVAVLSHLAGGGGVQIGAGHRNALNLPSVVDLNRGQLQRCDL